MKKGLLISVISFFASAISFSQNVNITLAAQLSYGTQQLSNICGWTDTVNHKEYALVGGANGLSVVDITTPSTPVQIVQIPGPSCTWREIKTYKHYAYVTTECGTVGLQIVDLSNLPSATLTTTTWTPNISGTVLSTIHALHIDEAKGKIYLYGSKVGNQGALIADIKTNPMVPIYLGKYDNRYIHDGYVRNDTLYACHIYQGDVEIVDCTNPAAGVSLADFTTPNNFAHNSWLSGNSKVCFTTDEVNNSYLAAFDISNLNNITELDRIQSNPGSQSVVHNVHIINVGGNDFAVTSWYNDGFTIVDAGRPNNLVQVGNYDTAPTVSGGGMDHDWGVFPFFPSGTIVASDIENGLFVCKPTYVRASYLEGTVKDCSTGNYLSGAKVQIQNPPSYNISSATDLTDGLGQYGVGVAVAGTYTVTVSKQAYVSQTFTVSVSSGNVTTLNVYLCTQSPAFAYTGQVFDNSSSNGIQGVHVHLQDSTIVWDTITNASGNFTIPAMLTGTYDILVGEWGYITKCFSGQAINATASTFSVGLDHGYYDDFSLDYGWTVSGACANKWERCVPVGTYDANNGNAVANPAVDVSNDCSNQCYVTDNGGGAAYDHDVDPPGYTILTSPIFDVSSYTNAYVSYYRWFYDAMLNGNAPNDTMSIFISNGTNTVLMERMVKNTAGNGTWAHKSFQVSGFVTPSATMQIILQISDAMPGSVVEGGLDKFFVFDSTNNAVNEVSTSVKVSVYPNPFTEKTTLLITNGRVLDPTLKVYNMFGEEVAAEVAVIPSGFTIQRGSLPKGIYFYKIISGKENLATGKLVVD